MNSEKEKTKKASEIVDGIVKFLLNVKEAYEVVPKNPGKEQARVWLENGYTIRTEYMCAYRKNNEEKTIYINDNDKRSQPYPYSSFEDFWKKEGGDFLAYGFWRS